MSNIKLSSLRHQLKLQHCHVDKMIVENLACKSPILFKVPRRQQIRLKDTKIILSKC